MPITIAEVTIRTATDKPTDRGGGDAQIQIDSFSWSLSQTGGWDQPVLGDIVVVKGGDLPVPAIELRNTPVTSDQPGAHADAGPGGGPVVVVFDGRDDSAGARNNALGIDTITLFSERQLETVAASAHPGGANVVFCDGSVRFADSGADLVW